MISRRSFLAVTAGAGAGLLLTACGSSDGGDQAGTDTSGDGSVDDDGTTPSGGYDLVRRFPTTVLVPGMVRMPISLGLDGEPLTDGPDEPPVGPRRGRRRGAQRSHRHQAQRGPAPRVLVVRRRHVDNGDLHPAGRRCRPAGRSVPGQRPLDGRHPARREPLPPFDTPTVDDAGGVDPISHRCRPVRCTTSHSPMPSRRASRSPTSSVRRRTARRASAGRSSICSLNCGRTSATS